MGKFRPSLETWAKTWPTPGANDWKGSHREGQRRGQLDEAVEAKWPTPTAMDAVGPRNRTARRRPGAKKANIGDTLTDMIWQGAGLPPQTTPTDGESGSTPEARRLLNPEFVEALMGLPVGWTDPLRGEPTDFEPSETP